MGLIKLVLMRPVFQELLQQIVTIIAGYQIYNLKLMCQYRLCNNDTIFWWAGEWWV